MKVCSSVFLLFFVSKHFAWCNVINTEVARAEKILMPFVYLKNFNSSDNTTLQVPYLVVPILILPLDEDQKPVSPNVEIKTNNLESDGAINQKYLNETTKSEKESENEDIEINFRQSLNRGAKFPRKSENKSEDGLAENVENNNSNLATKSTDEVNNIIFENQNNVTSVEDRSDTQNTPNNSNVHSSHNENKLRDSLSLATLKEETNLPATEDKRWENFTVSANISINKTSGSNNLTPPKRLANSSKSLYSDALYNNAVIDQLSITTNSYTNLETTTAENDRWTAFSSLGGAALKPTGFKPLAGLYYDGFLHTPLIKMPGFNPHGDYYYP